MILGRSFLKTALRQRGMKTVSMLFLISWLMAGQGVLAQMTGIICSGDGAAVRLSGENDREWTEERMGKARPYPLPVLPAEPNRGRAAAEALSTVPPVFIPGSPDGVGYLPGIDPQSGGVEPTAVIDPLGYSYPPPYTRYRNFDNYKRYPYRTVGKFFFTQMGTDYVCSAASIGNFAIWTAGHCVHAGNNLPSGWSTNIHFVPAYKKGDAPYGKWKGVEACTTDSWYAEGGALDFRYDMGGVILKKRKGQKISKAVGNLGFAANLSNDTQHWFDIGYPEAPFNGGVQQICAASYAYSDTNYPGGPYPVAMGCDQAPGSSGGPWILDFRGGSYLNGHNSYRYNGFPEEIFSPYFGDVAQDLHQRLLDERP
jgi:V8-like Glu-specific endopeptidase